MLSRLKWIGCLVVLVPFLFSPAARAADEPKAGDDEEESEDANKPDADQPKYTAGALWKRDTYSSTEVERPLNLTGGMIEGRLDFLTDIAKGSSFKNFTMRLAARYGFTDTLEFDAGLDLHLAAPEGATKEKSIFVAVQQSILHDLLAGRLEIILPVDPDFLFDVALGFPIKFRLIPDKIAIEALEQIIIFHFAKPSGAESTQKPEINIAVGGVFQILENLALRVRAQVRINLDDTSRTQIPVEVDIQYTPINLLDFGLFARLDNLNPQAIPPATEKPSPFDARSIGLFVRARY
jgi:hypothetical protein